MIIAVCRIVSFTDFNDLIFRWQNYMALQVCWFIENNLIFLASYNKKSTVKVNKQRFLFYIYLNIFVIFFTFWNNLVEIFLKVFIKHFLLFLSILKFYVIVKQILLILLEIIQCYRSQLITTRKVNKNIEFNN